MDLRVLPSTQKRKIGRLLIRVLCMEEFIRKWTYQDSELVREILLYEDTIAEAILTWCKDLAVTQGFP